MRTTVRRLDVGLVVAAASFAFASSARADDSAKPEMEAAAQSVIFQGDAVSNAYEDMEKWKKDNGVPIEVGAWHWWHMNRNSPHDLHYGLPTLGGTYFWYLHFDPETTDDEGQKMGLHVDARFRDGDERFRPFFESRAWLWEAYAWYDLCDTRLKAGKIWRRFGLDWDGSWYGNVPYFDGWKLDPDWGVAAERTFTFGDIKAPSFIQGFFAEDRVNGSISGADAESDDMAREKLSLSARTVPHWDLDGAGSLDLGLSWQVGQIDERAGGIHNTTAGAVDLTWTNGPTKVYGEVMRAVGERNSANYVTGGPSNRAEDWLFGAQYQWRFATLRATVSHGTYDNPDGKQIFYLLGVTLAVTKNVDFYVEWVGWDVAAKGGPRTEFEDGVNFVLNWRF